MYFPYDKKDKRLTDLHEDIEHLLFGQDESSDFAKGVLEDRKKPIIFSMARLDRYALHTITEGISDALQPDSKGNFPMLPAASSSLYQHQTGLPVHAPAAKV